MYYLLEAIMCIGDKLMKRQTNVCSYEAYNSGGRKTGKNVIWGSYHLLSWDKVIKEDWCSTWKSRKRKSKENKFICISRLFFACLPRVTNPFPWTERFPRMQTFSAQTTTVGEPISIPWPFHSSENYSANHWSGCWQPCLCCVTLSTGLYYRLDPLANVYLEKLAEEFAQNLTPENCVLGKLPRWLRHYWPT